MSISDDIFKIISIIALTNNGIVLLLLLLVIVIINIIHVIIFVVIDNPRLASAPKAAGLLLSYIHVGLLVLPIIICLSARAGGGPGAAAGLKQHFDLCWYCYYKVYCQ